MQTPPPTPPWAASFHLSGSTPPRRAAQRTLQVTDRGNVAGTAEVSLETRAPLGLCSAHPPPRKAVDTTFQAGPGRVIASNVASEVGLSEGQGRRKRDLIFSSEEALPSTGTGMWATFWGSSRDHWHLWRH